MDSFKAAFPVALSPSHWQLLQAVLRPHTVAKREMVLQPGQICNRVYFVQRGLLRHYVLHEGKEVNTHFAQTGTFTTDFTSLSNQLPAATYIEALEKTELLVLARADMLALYAQAPELQAGGRALLEQLLGQHQMRLTMHLHRSAAARYRYLCEHQPDLLQAVSLQQLASYLGVSRETLSRVRAK